jgi:dTDP-4-dehydrorhamnose reductase
MTAEDVLQKFLPFSERILITGCHGLLGQKLFSLLSPTNEIVGLDLHPDSHLSSGTFQYRPLDITRSSELLDAVIEIKPTVIVNTAAMTGVDRCEEERDLCWRINVLAVETLLRAARKVKAHLIQISSDYVFDGKHPPYTETDPTNPLGFYGKSKLASENILRGSTIRYTIVRTQVLYGAALNIRPNFVDFVLQKLRQGEPFSIVDDQVGNPTLADDLAEGIARIIQLRRTGIYHISGSESLSRYDFARRIALQFGEDPERIKPLKTETLQQKAPRPQNSTFCLDKIWNDLRLRTHGVSDGLQIYRRQLEELQTAPGGNTR